MSDNPTLDDVLAFGKKTIVGECYLPVDETIPDFDENWLREIILKEDSREEKIKAIKDHEYIRKANLVKAELEELGLSFLYYDFPDELSNKRQKELVFLGSGSFGLKKVRLSELDNSFMPYLESMAHDKWQKGYGYDDIDTRLANIEQLGDFKIGLIGQCSNGMQSIYTDDEFWYGNCYVKRIYRGSVNQEKNIDNINIIMIMNSNNPQLIPPLMKVELDVKNIDGKYVAEADIVVESCRLNFSDSRNAHIHYHFDSNGELDSMGVDYTDTKYDRKDMEAVKAMQKVYANLAGILWQDGQNYTDVTDGGKGKLFALMMGPDEKNHAISSLNNGDSIIGKDYTLVPFGDNLKDAPGLSQDLYRMEIYGAFADELVNMPFFKGSNFENLRIDYVPAFKSLAKIRNNPSNEIPLLYKAD